MGAIHELRAEYRHFRLDNPHFRWVFMLAEFSFLMLKLALFAGFLYGCWYLVSGGASPVSTGTVVEVQSRAAEPIPVPELTAERIALLESIAGRKPIGSSGANEVVPDSTDDSDKTGIEINSAVLVATSLESAGILLSDSPDQSSVLIPSSSSSSELEDSLSDSIVPLPLVEQHSGNGRDWILEQPPGNYTVQIAMTANRPFLESFAKQLPDSLETAIYPERRTNSGVIQYSLSLGNFNSLFSARNALSSLSQTHKRYGAHLRRFDDIQNTVSNFMRNVVQ